MREKQKIIRTRRHRMDAVSKALGDHAQCRFDTLTHRIGHISDIARVSPLAVLFADSTQRQVGHLAQHILARIVSISRIRIDFAAFR